MGFEAVHEGEGRALQVLGLANGRERLDFGYRLGCRREVIEPVLGDEEAVVVAVSSCTRGKDRMETHLSSIRTPPTYQYFSSRAWSTNSEFLCGAKRCSLK